MATYQAGYVEINTTTLNATHSITLTGFSSAPNYMRFWTVGRTETVAAAGRRNVDLSFGIATAANSRACMAGHTDDAAAISQAGSYYRTDCIAVLLDHSSTEGTDGRIDINSVSNTAIELINDEALGHAVVLGYECAVFTNAAIGEVDEPGATGNFSETGLAFQPDYVEFIASAATAVDTHTNSMQLSYGMAKSSSERGCVAVCDTDNQAAMIVAKYMPDSECISVINGSSGVMRCDFVAFTSDGFTLNCTERNSTRKIAYIATKGGSVKIDGFAVSTSNGGTTARSSYGFQPQGAAVMGVYNTAASAADTVVEALGLSLGATDASTSHGQALAGSDAVADSVISSAIRFDAAYVNVAAAGTLNGYGTVQSFGADGLTWVQTDATGAADYIIVRAMRPPSAGTLTMGDLPVVAIGLVVGGAAEVITETPGSASDDTLAPGHHRDRRIRRWKAYKPRGGAY